jgi:hypothetical protein
VKAATAIKRYFEADPHGRKVTVDELKELERDDRRELGSLACVELDEEFEDVSQEKAA